MITAQQFLEAAARHHGYPYDTRYSRFGQSRPKHFDCSGHVWAALAEAGAPWNEFVSSEQYKACFPIPLAVAVQTPGSLIFMPADPTQGSGSGGHVAIVGVFGMTSEARGHAWGVGSWKISGRGFSPRAGLCPLVNYKLGPTPPGAPGPITVTPDVIAGTAWLAMQEIASGPVMGTAGTHTTLNNSAYAGPEVAAWQTSLNLIIHAGLSVNGVFDVETARQTGQFQKVYNALAKAAVVPTFGVVEDRSRQAMVHSLANLIETVGK